MQAIEFEKVDVMKKGGWNIKERTKKLALSFSLRGTDEQDVLVSRESFGCDCRGGILKTAPGGARVLGEDGNPVTMPVGVQLVRLYKVYDSTLKTYRERYCALTESGDFYAQEESGEFWLAGTGYQGAAIERFAGANDRYKLAVIGERSCVVYKDDGSFDMAALEGTRKIGCFFNHRLFVGMKPSKIVCSAPEEEVNFTESITDGGMLAFPCVGGQIVAIKGYQGRLYLFFEYGILQLTTAGSVKDFSVKTIEYAGGKIFSKTVCVGARGVYFLASDGAYRFDGDRAERLLAGFVIAPSEETFLEGCGVYGGRVFMRYLTKSGYKTLAFYEDGKDGFYMEQLPALSGEEGGRCLFTDETGALYGLSQGGSFGFDGDFLGAETDFGVVGRKTLKKLSFTGKGRFTLTVKTGGRSFEREVVFQDGRAEILLSERGERFAFDFHLNYGTVISNMAAEFTSLR